MTPPPSRGAQWAKGILVGIVVAFSAAVSAGAAWISFHTIQSLAIFLHWDPGTAWLVMPLIEAFLVVGAAEDALRSLEGRADTIGPKVAAYSALVATLGCNVAWHVLLLLSTDSAAQLWRVVILGTFAALVPTAQIGALHFMTDRLGRIARGGARRPGPGVLARMVRGAGAPATAPAPTPARARTGTGARPRAGAGTAAKPVELMRAHWDAQVAQGRVPSLGELDRASGRPASRMAKKYRPGWEREAIAAGLLGENVTELRRAAGHA